MIAKAYNYSIYLKATGANIARLRQERGISVAQLQSFYGFEYPQAIYKWQSGQSLPNIENLYALASLFDVTIDEILIPSKRPQDPPCGH